MPQNENMGVFAAANAINDLVPLAYAAAIGFRHAGVILRDMAKWGEYYEPPFDLGPTADIGKPIDLGELYDPRN